MMGGKHSRPRVRASTVIIAVMYASVVLYVAFNAWYYERTFTFLPDSLTAMVGAVFVGETVSLAKLRMAKEQGGQSSGQAHTNNYLEQLGVYDLETFDDVPGEDGPNGQYQE